MPGVVEAHIGSSGLEPSDRSVTFDLPQRVAAFSRGQLYHLLSSPIYAGKMQAP